MNNEVIVVSMRSNDGIQDSPPDDKLSSGRCFLAIPFLQKVIAEAVGTYFMIFAGCGVVVVDAVKEKAVTLPGISLVWGSVVMVMIYAVGHISGAHFNPAVTLAFASCNRFPWKQVPGYIFAQVLASILASGTLRLLFSGPHDHFAGTIPAGSNAQSLVLEFIITFYLMFVISAVATDSRAAGNFAGIAIGFTIMLNAMFAGPISGASMNPARSFGPAIIWNRYTGLWIYVLGPITGAVAGAWVYNIIRFRDKPLCLFVTPKQNSLNKCFSLETLDPNKCN
ncbi:hypothetical protein ACS0TY_015659 [Phlomoides rotata]